MLKGYYRMTKSLGFVAPVAHGSQTGAWLNAPTREMLIDKMIRHIGTQCRYPTYDLEARDRNYKELRRQLEFVAA